MADTRALRSVREQRGLGLEDVAAFAAISPRKLADFENGGDEPSRKQIERLADLYGVPSYSFFGPGIPNLPPLPRDFRKVNPSPATLSPRGLKTITVVEKISEFTAQLSAALGFQGSDFAPGARRFSDPERGASDLRAAFTKWLDKHQERFDFSGPPEHQFMASLRLFFEAQGNLLNVNDAPPGDFAGFYLRPVRGVPTAFVNRNILSKKAQVFTLAHEYAHYLLAQEGISDPVRSKNETEKTCNLFAAEFLAPMATFRKVVERINRDTRANTVSFVNAVSANSLLSRYAAAIRLHEGGYMSRKDLSMWVRVAASKPREEKEREKENSNSGHGQPHAKRLGEIGQLPVYLAARAVSSGLIDQYDVSAGLGLSESLQSKAFSLASRRFDVALS